VAGCDYVLHVASPFPPAAPEHEDELIVPAREGALRVLRAARDAGVKRVVLTSSFAAVGYGHAPRSTPFDETSWTDPDSDGVRAYVKSKTLAERAAWHFVADEGGGIELSVVNPVGILGPVLGPDYATSILMVQRLMDGAMPGCPELYFGIVDVRDVADLHVRTMTDPAAAGERFIAISGSRWSRSRGCSRRASARPRAGCQRGSSPSGSSAWRPSATPPSGNSHPSSGRRGTRPVRRPSDSWAGSRDLPRKPSSRQRRAWQGSVCSRVDPEANRARRRCRVAIAVA